MSVRTVTLMVAGILVAAAFEARAATLYVADNGVDSPACGATDNRCRSISRAIANANPGDLISVGPGRYGDLNENGVTGETGEETGSPGCGCMLSVNKAVTVFSSAGAASTLIDGATVDVATTVLLIMPSGAFGQVGKGFTITSTARQNGTGIAIDSGPINVRGHRVISQYDRIGYGIYGVNAGPLLIEGNEVIRWANGIRVMSGTTVSKNVVLLNGVGINSEGAVVGNVALENSTGIALFGSASAQTNAAFRNGTGLVAATSGPVHKNNIFRNGCGVQVISLAADLTNNYWGDPTGPGGNPADTTCGGSATTTPFKLKPVAVTPLKP